MIWSIFSLVISLFLYYRYAKKQKTLTFWAGVILVLFYSFLDLHYIILGNEIERFYSASGTGAGLSYKKCVDWNINGSCNNTATFEKWGFTDPEVTRYVAYRESEKGVLEILSPLLWAAILGFTLGIIYEVFKKEGLIPNG